MVLWEKITISGGVGDVSNEGVMSWWCWQCQGHGGDVT